MVRPNLFAFTLLVIGTVACPPRTGLPPSPGGTYSQWSFDVAQLAALEWTMTPLEDPAPSLAAKNLLHYYAYEFAVMGSTPEVGGGYAGFQSNGIFDGVPVGKAINFSIWGSNGGEGPALVRLENPESNGAQIMTPFEWTEGRSYRFELTTTPATDDSLGRWWSLDVTDTETSSKTHVGRIRVPRTINGQPSEYLRPRTSAFGEDLHWWRTLNGKTLYPGCESFERSSMLYSDIAGYEPDSLERRPAAHATAHTNSGAESTGSNAHRSQNCAVTVFVGANNSVQHNLGFWDPPAPDLSAR